MSVQALDSQQQILIDPLLNPRLARLDRFLRRLQRFAVIPCMLALVGAACVLTYSVFARYFFKITTDWVDEGAVFLLVGATFFSGAYVQSYRGHVGIEALATVLPKNVNRIRIIFVDLVTVLFCSFFAWKSWTLFHEAFVDKQTTTSSWAPPLWIPYGIMALGMTLLSIQALGQLIVENFATRPVVGDVAEHPEWIGD